MANGGSITWVLDIDDNKFNTGVKKASAEAHNLSNNIESVGSKIRSSFDNAAVGSMAFAGGLVAAGTAIGGAVLKGLSYTAQIENITTAFETITGSSASAKKAIERIRDVAKESPFFDTSTLARTVQGYAAAGQGIDQAIKSGILFGDVTAAFGKGSDEMTRMGNTLTQVMGKGKADIVDFKELTNAGWTTVRKDVAGTMGVTMTQFEEMVSAGTIGYAEIEKAALKYTGSAERASTNLTALWGRFQESMGETLGKIVTETGIFDNVKLGLEGLITYLEDNQDTIINFIKDTFGWIKDNGILVSGILLGALLPAIISVAGGLWAMMAPLLPFIAIGALIGFVVQKVVEHFGGWDEVMKKIQPTLDLLGSIFRDVILPQLMKVWDAVQTNLLPALQRLWNVISPILIPVLKVLAVVLGGVVLGSIMIIIKILQVSIKVFSEVVSAVASLVEKIVAFFKRLSTAVTEAWNAVIGQFKSWVGEAFSWGKQLAESFVNGFKALGDLLKNAAISALNKAKSILKGKSPPPEGPFKRIDEWGMKIGQAWVTGFEGAINSLGNSFEVNGSLTSNGKLAYATSTPNFTVNIGTYAGTDMEKRELARQIFEAYDDYAKSRGLNI